MLFSFWLNRSNGSFLSPTTWCAREIEAIIPFSENSINNRASHRLSIVPQLPKLLSHYKTLCSTFLFILTARMSSKSAKIAKTKHGVKVMGLKKDSSVSKSISSASALVEHQETLNLKPLQHAPPLVAHPDFPKKKFKTRYSTRYRHSKKGKGSTSSTTPIKIPDEEDVIVDEVITKVVDDILGEAATKALGSDVVPDVTTTGTSDNPSTTNPFDVSV